MKRRCFTVLLTTTALVLAWLTMTVFVTAPTAWAGQVRLGQLPLQIYPSVIEIASIQRINGQTPSPSPIRSTTSSWASSAWEIRHQPI